MFYIKCDFKAQDPPFSFSSIFLYFYFSFWKKVKKARIKNRELFLKKWKKSKQHWKKIIIPPPSSRSSQLADYLLTSILLQVEIATPNSSDVTSFPSTTRILMPIYNRHSGTHLYLHQKSRRTSAIQNLIPLGLHPTLLVRLPIPPAAKIPSMLIAFILTRSAFL